MRVKTNFDGLGSGKKLVANFETVRFRQSNGETLADLAFFLASREYKVLGARLVQAVAGSDGGAVTLMLEKLTGTQAPGSGTALLTSAWDLKATANTPQTGTLVASSATKTLAAGNRLGLNLTGTPTAVAGVVVEVDLEIVQPA
jgi:hypothetical protein